MEQRPLRLGDTVDDYCPRERRITNHVIVAIVDDAIRQTRCTTCDAEHVYKHAKEPRRRKTDSLFDQVLADMTGGQLVAPRRDEPASHPADADEERPGLAAAAPQEVAPPQTDPEAVSAPEPEGTRPDESWFTHRQLIRATLPKVDGEPPPPRPIPEFTMHQRPATLRRGGQFGRNGPPHGVERNGNVAFDSRNGRQAPGNGHGPHRGHGQPAAGRGRPRRRRNKNRSR
jgi:hypothetical protein